MKLTPILLCTLFAGLAAFCIAAYTYELIVINPRDIEQTITPASKEIRYTLWLYTSDDMRHTQESCMQPESSDSLLYHIVQRWFYYAYQEGICDSRIAVQSTALTNDGTILFIACDRNPLPIQSSTIQRLNCIKGLLKTLAYHPTIQHVRILAEHRAIDDPCINMEIDWPINLVER